MKQPDGSPSARLPYLEANAIRCARPSNKMELFLDPIKRNNVFRVSRLRGGIAAVLILDSRLRAGLRLPVRAEWV